MKALDQLVAVLCDPSGKCCIHGSEADRQIVDDALAAIRTELAAVQSDHEIRHWAEEYECTIKCLDDAKVPKSDSEGGAYSLWGRIQAYCTTQPASGEVTDAEITQAVARGWIHYKNCDKEMDVDLAFAISEEISKLLAAIRAELAAVQSEPVQPASGEVTDAERKAFTGTWFADKFSHSGFDTRATAALSEFLSNRLAVTSAKPEGGAKDAERYRWLRLQDWFDSNLCVLRDPKQFLTGSKGLGADCPSRERLDTFIDAAIASQKGAA